LTAPSFSPTNGTVLSELFGHESFDSRCRIAMPRDAAFSENVLFPTLINPFVKANL